MNKLIIFGLFLGISLFAEDSDRDEEGRVRPGTRMMAHTEWLQIAEERAKEDETTVEDLVCQAVNSKEEGAAFEAGVYYSSHKGAFSAPKIVTAFGGIVELQDGSIWAIADGDRYKTLNWLTSDAIVISPNHEWFSSHSFRMTNQNTGIAVKCNLKCGPIYNGLYSHWIVAINYYTQELFLEDGSIWQVSGFDSSTFGKWMTNDTIIIGINDGFLQSSRPNILINVETLSHVRAICTFFAK